MAEVEGELLVQPIDERGAVLFQKGDKADGPFLRMAAGKGERARVHELTAQRFVAELRRLNHLAVQRLEVALHPFERRARGGLERWIECWKLLIEPRHLRVDRLLGRRERIFD